MYRQVTTYSFGTGLSPLGRKVLITLVVLYIVQTILQNWMGVPVLETMAWWTPGSGYFRPWQPVTAFFLNGPTPLGAFISWLILYFFFTPAESSLGRRGLLEVIIVSWLSAVILLLPLLSLGAIVATTPYLGINCFLTALIVVFGLSRPNATILLFFVLPIRAAWVAWGTGFISFLYLVYTRDMSSAVALFGWAGAVLYMISGGRITNLIALLRARLLARRIFRRSSRRHHLDVLDGGRSRRSGQDDDDILYH